MKIILIIVVVAIALGIAWQVFGNRNSNMKNDVKKIDLVLDVRTVEEWNQGHGARSMLIPVQELEARVGELASYKDKKVVVVCRTGNRANTAIEILKKAGFTQLENGGAWENYR